MSSPQLDQILLPLQGFCVPFMTNEFGIHLWDSQHRGRYEEMSHAEFLRQQVLPITLKAACDVYGVEVVAQELVTTSLPSYGILDLDLMSKFWCSTIRGHEGSDPKYAECKMLNPALAAKFGVKNFFEPILQLAHTHKETNVFGVHKFLTTHACRMGGIGTVGKLEDFRAYITLAQRLLRSGTYDWSIELSDHNWQAIEPVVKEYGIGPVLEPVVDIMTGVLRDKPCTRDEKYHHSFFMFAMEDLVPVLAIAAKVAKSTTPIRTIMEKIGKALEALHTFGAFQHDNQQECSKEFFRSFGQIIARSLEIGLDSAIAEACRHWTPRLVPDGRTAAT